MAGRFEAKASDVRRDFERLGTPKALCEHYKTTNKTMRKFLDEHSIELPKRPSRYATASGCL